MCQYVVYPHIFCIIVILEMTGLDFIMSKKGERACNVAYSKIQSASKNSNNHKPERVCGCYDLNPAGCVLHFAICTMGLAVTCPLTAFSGSISPCYYGTNYVQP